jgi:hypothetical protein
MHLLKIGLGFTLLFAACIGLIRARPYDDSELRAFLTPPDGCQMPCFMGIRPGVTTREEAFRRLRTDDWTNGIVVNYVDRIVFRWSGLQPGIIREDDYGELVIRDEKVNAIYVSLTTPFADTWLAFGPPDWTEGTLVYLASGTAWSQRTGYARVGLHVDSLTACPMKRDSFWNSAVSIALAEPSVDADPNPTALTRDLFGRACY